MNFLKVNWQKAIALVSLLSLPVVSLALNTTCNPGVGRICDPLGGNGNTSIGALIQNLLTGALKLGIPVVALAIVYCGFLFVFARGNSEKLSQAKQALMYTLIGAAILLGAWALATMIQATVTALATP